MWIHNRKTLLNLDNVSFMEAVEIGADWKIKFYCNPPIVYLGVFKTKLLAEKEIVEIYEAIKRNEKVYIIE